MIQQWKMIQYQTLRSFIQWEMNKIQTGKDGTFENEQQMFDTRVVELKMHLPARYLITNLFTKICTSLLTRQRQFTSLNSYTYHDRNLLRAKNKFG